MVIRENSKWQLTYKKPNLIIFDTVETDKIEILLNIPD